MKKNLSIIVTIIMSIVLMILLTTNCNADTLNYTNDQTGEEYTISGPNSDGNYQITNYESGTVKDIVVPSEILSHTIYKIGEEAFKDNTNITSISVPNTITAIDSNAFSGCTALTKVTLPNVQGGFMKNSFSGCTHITEFNLGGYLVYSNIDDGMIMLDATQFPALLKITAAPNNFFYRSQNGMLVSIDKKVLAVYPAGLLTEKYIVDDSFTAIGEAAFSANRNVKEIILPDTIKQIRTRAFENCAGLTKLVVPDSVTTLGSLFVAGSEEFDYALCMPNLKIYCRSGSTIAEETTIPQANKIIDDIAPNITSFKQNGSTLEVTAVDTGAGIEGKAYSYDNKQTWTMLDKYPIVQAGTYKVYVRDTLGNISEASVTVDKVENTLPTLEDDTSSSAEQDKTQSTTKLPQTGVSAVVFALIIVAGIVVVIVRNKYKKYNY